MARPKSTLLTREIIGQAAIELVDSGHELQVMPLAKRLGVSASSLYHHVDGRVGIIRAMREVLSEKYMLAAHPGTDWQDTVRNSARTLFNLYGNHPRVMPLLLGVTIDEPGPIEFYAVLADAFDQAGIPEDEQVSTIETLEAFAFGVALDALSPDLIYQPEDTHSRLGELMSQHPTGKARNELLFERGLELLLLGIRERARIAATQ